MTAPTATPPVAPATDSLKTRRFALAAWLLLLVFPWALYLVNDSWAYNHRFETAGIYTGYFLYWHDYLRIIPNFYPGSRLLWITPGWLAYHLFTPYWANLALRAGVIFGTAAPSWLTLRRLGAGLGGATLGTMLLISNPYFLQAAGWDYVDGAGILCIAWSLFFLAGAASTPRRARWLLAAGAAMIATIWTYLMLGVLAPVFAWFYLRQRGWPRFTAGLRELGWLLLGGGLLTALLGLLNWSMGGRFLFFLLQFMASKSQMESLANGYHAPEVWLPASPWLIVPGLAVLAGTLLALPSVRKRWAFDRRAEAAGLAMVLVFAILTYEDLSGTWVVLHYSYATHAVYLLPFAYLPLGLVADRHLARLPPRTQMGWLLAAALLLLLMYFGPWTASLRHGPLFSRGTIASLAVAAAFLAAVWRPTIPGLLILVLGLGWLNLGTATHAAWRIPAQPDARDAHLLIFDVLDKIAPLNPDGRLMLWYHKNPSGPDNALLANFVTPTRRTSTLAAERAGRTSTTTTTTGTTTAGATGEATAAAGPTGTAGSARTTGTVRTATGTPSSRTAAVATATRISTRTAGTTSAARTTRTEARTTGTATRTTRAAGTTRTGRTTETGSTSAAGTTGTRSLTGHHARVGDGGRPDRPAFPAGGANGGSRRHRAGTTRSRSGGSGTDERPLRRPAKFCRNR